MLFEKLKTATQEPRMDVLTSRLLQTVIIASVALPVGKRERSTEKEEKSKKKEDKRGKSVTVHQR